MFDETLKRIYKKIKKEEKPFNAEYAWFESTYVEDYTDIQTRIKEKQTKIKMQIKNCFKMINSNRHEIYRCFVEIPSDLVNYTDEIFKPFINNGFKVVCLNDKIEELSDECIYLISWKHIYRNNSH